MFLNIHDINTIFVFVFELVRTANGKPLQDAVRFEIPINFIGRPVFFCLPYLIILKFLTFPSHHKTPTLTCTFVSPVKQTFPVLFAATSTNISYSTEPNRTIISTMPRSSVDLTEETIKEFREAFSLFDKDGYVTNVHHHCTGDDGSDKTLLY